MYVPENHAMVKKISTGIYVVKYYHVLVSCCQTALFFYIIGEDPNSPYFLFSDPQNLGVFLVGADLSNKGLLIGKNDET